MAQMRLYSGAAVGSEPVKKAVMRKVNRNSISNVMFSMFSLRILSLCCFLMVFLAIYPQQVSVFQLPEKGKVDSYNGSIKK